MRMRPGESEDPAKRGAEQADVRVRSIHLFEPGPHRHDTLRQCVLHKTDSPSTPGTAFRSCLTEYCCRMTWEAASDSIPVRAREARGSGRDQRLPR